MENRDIVQGSLVGAPNRGTSNPNKTAAPPITTDASFPSNGFDDILHGITADQACKECRRRKSKCDRGIPVCNLCVKYRRHCLYEKHARTPLTRRHLTEVEEKLRRAEAIIARMRNLVPEYEAAQVPNAVPSQTTEEEGPFNFATIPDEPGDPLNTSRPFETNTQWVGEPGDEIPNASDTQDAIASPPKPVSPIPETQSQTMLPQISDRMQETNPGPRSQRQPSPPYVPRSRALARFASRVPDIGASDGQRRNHLERAPADDFEWDEQDVITIASLSPEANKETDDAESVADGMATLAVNEKETGYLGVASGAALLRILEPARRRKSSPRYSTIQGQFPHTGFMGRPDPMALHEMPNINRHISDAMIDAYFRLYHVSYPIIHEPTFRAQYSEVIPRPNPRCWLVLAYVVAAIGVYTSSTTLDSLDLALFAHARSLLSFNFLEVGNLTLVQGLTLTSNYQQKRDKPNSGYNYLGLAVRMAMGLGLHKEFQGWNISPLNMEIRRRVWWTLCVFDVGATITFSRPQVWPYEGVDVSLPLNVNDNELTAASRSYPNESNSISPYTAVRTQARFHMATNQIYTRVISKPFPSSSELLALDRECFEPWISDIPSYFADDATVPLKYRLSHAVMCWRRRNLRIIMYRPFVIRRALNGWETRAEGAVADDDVACNICLEESKASIKSISSYWDMNEHNRLSAWYSLYFLFQAVLIPCICLRNAPHSAASPDWKAQIGQTLHTIAALSPVNASSAKCYQVINDLCGRYLDIDTIGPLPSLETSPSAMAVPQDAMHSSAMMGGNATSHKDDSMAGQGFMAPSGGAVVMEPINESPQTQINNVIPMMWPNVPPFEAADIVMGDDSWLHFLGGEAVDDERSMFEGWR